MYGKLKCLADADADKGHPDAFGLSPEEAAEYNELYERRIKFLARKAGEDAAETARQDAVETAYKAAKLQYVTKNASDRKQAFEIINAFAKTCATNDRGGTEEKNLVWAMQILKSAWSIDHNVFFMVSGGRGFVRWWGKDNEKRPERTEK